MSHELSADHTHLSFSPRTVRVSVPAKVAFDLGNMERVTRSILDRLGCPQCHSGFDIRFDMLRDFRVNESLEVFDAAGFGG